MDSTPFAGTVYTDFMAKLCAEREVETYLEIGVQSGLNIQKIKAKNVYAVDPAFQITVDPTVLKVSSLFYRGTSDSFFKSEYADLMEAQGVDFAFLDGMHLFEYLLRDIYNTEMRSKPSGLIALHDCMPFNSEMIERVRNIAGRKMRYEGAWTGDVWKVVPILKKYRPDLVVRLVDCAPTGLVFITNLDPDNTVLKDKYLEIVEEFNNLPNDAGAIEQYYAENKIYSSVEIGSNFNQSIFFRS